MVHRFIQLVGEGFADQLVGDQVGHRGVQRDQRLVEVGDVAVVHFLDQAMGEVGLVQQGVEAVVAVEQGRRGEEELFGELEHGLDAAFDAGLASDGIGGVEEIRHLVDVGVNETRQRTAGVFAGQGDALVQALQLALDQAGEMAVAGLEQMGITDQLTQCSGVHDSSKTTGLESEETP